MLPGTAPRVRCSDAIFLNDARKGALLAAFRAPPHNAGGALAVRNPMPATGARQDGVASI